MVSGEYPEPPRVDGHRRVQPEFGAEVCDDSRRQVRIRRLEPRVVGGGHKAVPLDEGVVALQEGGILRATRQPRRIPLHVGNGSTLGQAAGEESHTVTMSEMPAHNHFVSASSSQADSTFIQTAAPVSQNIFGTVAGGIYGPVAAATAMNPQSITNYGGSQAHENRQPFLVLTFVIALQGIFPSRN